MVTFLAVYRGDSISSARLVATSADPDLVSLVARRLLRPGEAGGANDEPDPVLDAIRRGRRAALRLIEREGSSAEASGDPPAKEDGRP